MKHNKLTTIGLHILFYVILDKILKENSKRVNIFCCREFNKQ